MRFVSTLLAVATTMGFALAAHAQVPQPAVGQAGIYPEGDLPLEIGQVIKDF